jgi:hypothetical protein
MSRTVPPLARAPSICYTRIRKSKSSLVHGKLVKIQHGPATVSVEVRSQQSTVPRGMGRQIEPLKRKSGDRPAKSQQIRSRGRSMECSVTFRAWSAVFFFRPVLL